MSYDYVEKITNAGKTSYKSLQELNEINTKIIQKLTDLQFKFTTYNIETGIEQTKLLTSSSNYKDLLSAESEFVSDYSTKVMDYTRQAASILTESRDELVTWIENGLSQAEKATKVQKAVKVPAAASTASKKTTKKAS